jgi:predicted phage terminase large subunit-like protein
VRPITPQELDRALVKRGGMFEFIRLSWSLVEPSTPFVDNWHIRAICNAAERCVQGDPEWARQVINVPPGHMKSLILAVFLPAWVWTIDPGFCSIYASFDIDISRRDAGRTLQILQSDWYRKTWPEVVLKFKSGRAAETLINNTAGGFRFATSVESKATGRHAHLRIVDDPIKPLDTVGNASVTRTKLIKAKTWWDSTMVTRTKDQQDRWMIVMQRLAEEDLAGYLLEKGSCKHICFPAEYDPARPCELDPRKVEGELLWPARFSKQTVDKLRDSLGIYAPAQLDQQPTNPGGEVFKTEWIQHWYTRPTCGQMVLSVDCTFKDTTGSDYVSIQVWGVAGASYYLLDQVLGRMSFTDTLEAIKGVLARHPYIGAKLIEDKANGPAVIDALSKTVTGVIPVMPLGGKVSRANAITYVWKAHNVFLPPTSVDWVPAYIRELVGFPRAKHDDQVDAMSQALTYLEANRSLLWDAMAVSGGAR